MGRHSVCAAVLLVFGSAMGQVTANELIQDFAFRSIGPAVTGGRVVDVEGHAAKPGLIFLAAAAGGVWKSENNATTWTPVFDNEKSSSIGDIAIAPSNPDIVWVGTGEHNNQRSAHYGDGVYKSIDGGKTWTNMGLKSSLHIGRIAIDPKNPDIVWVAAVGPLYKGGGDRGVFKTTNGGKTWQQVLRGINDTTGAIDIALDPNNPNVCFTAMYDRLRRAWNIRETGPGSALYRTKDGGKTWSKLAGGLPAGPKLGRIGVVVYPKDSKIVYTIIENQDTAVGNGLYKSIDGGETWKKTNTARVEASYYYSQVRVDPTNPDIVWLFGVQMMKSTDGGQKFTSSARNVHVDHHALWIDPNNNQRVLLGNDGGFYITYDQGANWDFINNLPIPQFYAIGADNAVPYNVMGGLQDNGVWHGPSRTRWQGGGIPNAMWKSIYGGDGFYSVPDPEDPTTVYTSSQFGSVGRVDVTNGRTAGIRPRDQGQRANWMAPFSLSPHNSKIIYWGGNKLYKSVNRGDSWSPISGDLTTNDEEKKKGNVPHCTITTVDESPARPNVIWVGTDDGNVWVTENGGGTWTQVNQNITGAPKQWWISRVEASPHDAATAFVSITGFREEEFRPLLYKTTDYGKTWTSIAGNLPPEQISVVRQDNKNPDLLIVGTEAGCYATVDGGKTYVKLQKGLPVTTPVQDLLIQDREGDLVIGTHGRGIYIMNIEPLRQLRSDSLDKDLVLFRPNPPISQSMSGSMFDAFAGSRTYMGQNPPWGVPISYYLKSPAENVKIEILDAAGNVIRELTGDKTPGIHVVQWDLRRSGGGGGPGGGGQAALGVGSYGVRVTAGQTVQTAVVQVNP